MTDVQAAAALAEEVYRRADPDQPISIRSINNKFGTSYRASDDISDPILNAAFVARQPGPDGFVYSLVNSGLVAG